MVSDDRSNLPSEDGMDLLALERDIVWFLGDAPEDATTILNYLSRSCPEMRPEELSRGFEEAVHELWKHGLISVCHFRRGSSPHHTCEEKSTRLIESVDYRSSENRWVWTTTRASHPVLSLTDEGYRACGYLDEVLNTGTHAA